MQTYSRHILNTLADWWQHPLKTAGVLLLIGMIVLSGPWACIVRCAMLEATQHRHGHHATVHGHEHVQHASDHHDQASSDPTLSNSAHDESISRERNSEGITALTIGIMPTLLLLVLLQMIVASLHLLPINVSSIVIPPPHRPPRTLRSFATA